VGVDVGVDVVLDVVEDESNSRLLALPGIGDMKSTADGPVGDCSGSVK
jgi:hypothetical protein